MWLLYLIYGLMNDYIFRDYNLKLTERSENKRTILISQSRRRRQQIWRPRILFLLQPETRKMIQKQPKIKLLLSQETKWILSVSVCIIYVYVHIQQISEFLYFILCFLQHESRSMWLQIFLSVYLDWIVLTILIIKCS